VNLPSQTHTLLCDRGNKHNTIQVDCKLTTVAFYNGQLIALQAIILTELKYIKKEINSSRNANSYLLSCMLKLIYLKRVSKSWLGESQQLLQLFALAFPPPAKSRTEEKNEEKSQLALTRRLNLTTDIHSKYKLHTNNLSTAQWLHPAKELSSHHAFFRVAFTLVSVLHVDHL